MNKAEDFIRQNTKTCSNIVDNYRIIQKGIVKPIYKEWLTSFQARRAVEIAREEMLNDICEWIEENIGDYCDGENIMFSATHIEDIDVFGQERFIKDLKQAMQDEQKN